MASSSQSSNFVTNFHRGGSFVRNPLTCDFEILSKVENVDLSSMDYDAIGRLIRSEFSGEVKSMFYLLPGKDLDSGLSSVFELNGGDGSDSDLEDDLFDYFSEEDSDTASVDHLIYSALDREEYVDTYIRPLAEDHDFVGDQFPIHDPSIKWKLMKQVLGERYESPEQLKRALAFYALANGYKLYYDVNTPRKLHAKCSKDSVEMKCPFRLWASWMSREKSFQIKTLIDQHACSRTYEYGTLITRSTCKLGVDNMPDGKNYFKTFYVCFKGVKQGWLQGCRRVIGLDGCFLKTICKGELLSAVGRDGNNQIYPIAWAVVLPSFQISTRYNVYTFRLKCARHVYANFRKKFNGVVYRNLFWKAAKATYPAKFERIMSEMKSVSMDSHKHLMERKLKSWSRAFFSTDKACDAVENGIGECFNALIVEARRKPIINMLEDIRLVTMERMQKMREKHEKWNDGICPNIRKKFEIIKDLHRVDERMMTCSCRAWQFSGIPCQHGCAAIYFLHKDPKDYISDWYEYTKPLPPVVKKMLGRPPHKIKRDAGEKDDGNRTRLGRKGVIMHCFICKKRDIILGVVQTKVKGRVYQMGIKEQSGSSVRGGGSTRGGGSARGGSTSGSSVRGGKTTRGGGSASGSQSARGGQGSRVVVKILGVVVKGGGLGQGGGIQGSALGSAQGSAMYGEVKGLLVVFKGLKCSKELMDPIDGETMVGNMQGIPVPAWPYDGSPADLLGADEISLTGTQPMASQDPIDELVSNVPAPNQPVQNVPALNQPALNVPAPIMRMESKRIKMIKFSKPVSPGPGLTLENSLHVKSAIYCFI
ncbi:transposase, MuDR, plant [Tanacetum coccineum]|uniref:Transposase, MuDR, plant n=1 Tax=Tanacetum coccineum TaxID=301880 RepID=A0ABQ5GL09_9ASTR